MATIDVKDAVGATVAIEKPLIPGRAVAASSRPVAVSNEDFAEIQAINTATTAMNTRTGSVTEVAPATDTASSGLNGRLQRIAQHFTTLIAKDFATQTTLASVLAKIIAAPATEAKQDTGNTSLGTIAGKDFSTQTTLASVLAKIIAAPATEAKQDSQTTLFGALTETAPVTDTASSGFNGRLQRLAQRLTSLIALFPVALGRAAATAGFRTVWATEDLAEITAIKTATEAIQVEAESEDNSPVEQKGGRVTSWFTLVTDDAALAVGDLVATAALDVTNFFSVAGEVRKITGIQIIDPSNFKVGMDVYLFDANQSMGTVNTAPTITAANMEKCMAMVPLDFTDYTTQTSTCARGFTGKERECLVAGVGTSLYINAVVRTAVTYGAIDLRIRITSEPA